MTPVSLSGVRELAERFDTFIVDQFGVLLDGASPYPGAIDTLHRLNESGKSVLILSNSGKRSKPNEVRLQGLGFPVGCWDHFLTSGEVAWSIIKRQLATKEFKAHARCLLIARDGDRSAVDGLDLVVTENGADCEFVLISGSEADRYDLDYYTGLLVLAARRGVPCFCTNPDQVMLTASGLRFGAGRIAKHFEELGGKVTWIGKPFPEIYTEALRVLGHPEPERTICIGDSLEHDIAGGHNSGLPTALVTTGILAHLSDLELAAEFEAKNAAPAFQLKSFVW